MGHRSRGLSPAIGYGITPPLAIAHPEQVDNVEESAK